MVRCEEFGAGFKKFSSVYSREMLGSEDVVCYNDCIKGIHDSAKLYVRLRR